VQEKTEKWSLVYLLVLGFLVLQIIMYAIISNLYA